jgi:hypothetical protein
MHTETAANGILRTLIHAGHMTRMISRLLFCAALVAEETSEKNALIKTMVSQIFTETVANGILITLILAEFMMEVISLLLCYAADVEVDYL